MTFDGILFKTNQHHHHQQQQQQKQTYVKDPEQECSRSKKLCSGKLLYLVHNLELVSKELNHMAAILHVYAGGLNFMW